MTGSAQKTSFLTSGKLEWIIKLPQATTDNKHISSGTVYSSTSQYFLPKHYASRYSIYIVYDTIMHNRTNPTFPIKTVLVQLTSSQFEITVWLVIEVATHIKLITCSCHWSSCNENPRRSYHHQAQGPFPSNSTRPTQPTNLISLRTFIVTFTNHSCDASTTTKMCR
jgi:hypothetical protein